ncbi:MAG: alpha/beta hydrolase [Pseudomonadota bacterium]
MTAPTFLDGPAGRKLAYSRLAGVGDGQALPGVVFLGGFASDMTGTKALWLEDWARARGRAYLRFDYSGHGASSERFEDGAISDWAADAEAALIALTEGPQILVGSSMGGWIALLLAKRCPERVAGLVGIAAAPDFTERMAAEATPEARAVLEREGRIEHPSDYGAPLVITRRLIEDGRANRVLTAPLSLGFPVRLLHGTEDADVPIETALSLLAHMECQDARLTLVKGADHRFSEPANLTLLGKTIHGISHPGEDTRA